MSGDFALHHAVKQSDLKSLQLLLPEKSPSPLNLENSLGLTPVDCAMQKAIDLFHTDRETRHYWRHQDVSEKIVDKDKTKILAQLTKVHQHKRVLAKGEDVTKAW